MLELPDDVDDVLVENAPVRVYRHGGLTVEGYSRAAVQTYWRIQELKLGFDLGLQPWSFMTTKSWAVSHTHMDHIAGLPAYVARRRLMKMAPPTIYLPGSAIADVEALLSAFTRLDRGRLPCDLVGVKPGDEFHLSREHVLSVVRTFHTIESVGYILWERRNKLRDEFKDCTGPEIRDLRLSGTEVTREERTPLVGYLGDSNPQGLDENPDFYRTKILIMEITFFDPKHRRDRIHKYGHIHLDDVIERAEAFGNECIIASHFSTRYADDRIRSIVNRRLPDCLRDRLMLWI